MKNAKIIMICIFTAIIIICCGNKTEPAKKKSFDNSFTERLTPSNKEIVALLSVKYSVDEKVVEILILEYKNEHSIRRLLRKSIASDNVVLKRNINYKDTIISLSNKYSLPKEKVASMLFDYKIYTDCISREENLDAA